MRVVVSVVKVWVVGMLVPQWRVLVPMRMRFSRRVSKSVLVLVLVMLIMNVAVLVI